MTIVRIRKKSSSLAIKYIAADTISLSALTTLKCLTQRTSKYCWEETTRGSRCYHTYVVNVWIKRPGSHISHVVASELIAAAYCVVEGEWTVIGDRIISVVSPTEHVYINQIRSWLKAHAVALAVEGIRTAEDKFNDWEPLKKFTLTILLVMCKRSFHFHYHHHHLDGMALDWESIFAH
jgi:hypothetical protein